MTLRVVILLGLILTMSACASRLNPLNWFGGAREERIEVAEEAIAEDPRGLVDQVIGLNVDPLPSGAVVTATGLPNRQGFWAADLVETERGDGRIVFEFRIVEPLGPTNQGSQRSREVITGTELSNQDLAGIRQIVVEGARNRLTVRR